MSGIEKMAATSGGAVWLVSRHAGALEWLRRRTGRADKARNDTDAAARKSGPYERIIAVESLREGWRRVRANGGGAGGDGQTLEDFARRLEEELHRLHKELQRGAYRPGLLRPARMPKADGGWRPLRIPCVRDRVVQASCQLQLLKLLDARQHERSFAYRPGRSVEMALARLRQDLEEGHVWVVDADIEKFFDNVEHTRLLRELKQSGVERRVRRLIGLWLPGFGAGGRGLAQGSPVSPVLANVFLHPVDVALQAHGVRFVRYADDFVLACRTQRAAGEARHLAARLLAKRGLRLHTGKTRVVSAAEGFVFLGQQVRLRVEMRKVEATGMEAGRW